MNFLKIIFIAISKIYINFSKGEEDWFYLPVLIISSVIGFNLLILLMHFLSISFLYPIIFIIVLYFLLILLFGKFKKRKTFIKDYKLSKWNYFFIVLFFIIDIAILIYSLNTTRVDI